MATHEAAIGLGSNLGHSQAIVQAAWLDLQGHPDIIPVAISSPYHSQPVGMDSANWFVNAAALVRTRLQPLSLLLLLHEIEERHGRVRDPQQCGFHDRTLDLDILLYEGVAIRTDHLVVPHPLLEQRLFVLAPLAEIAGEHCHPLSGATIRKLCYDLKKHAGRNQIVEKCSWDMFVSFFTAIG